jgi:hypothetical protein
MRPHILATAQAQFPRSANKTVTVDNAWRPVGSESRPEPSGMNGWTRVGKLATYEVVKELHDQGFTWVNLCAGGTSNPFRDVPISALI